MQPLMSEQTFIIISCTSTYGVHLCVKFNKTKNTLNGFEGLQVLWTDGGGVWDFRPDRFFSGKNQGKKLTPPSNNLCVFSRNGGGVNFSWLNPKCSSVRPSEIGTDISHVVMM